MNLMNIFISLCFAFSSVTVKALTTINAHHVGNADNWSHYRVCEGQAAVFSCDADGLLKVGGCWYGSPNSDVGDSVCPHPAVGGDCPANGGVCMPAIQALCENKPGCTVPATNEFMMAHFGDPCPGTYKYAAIALRCECPWYAVWCSVLQLGRSEPIHIIGDGTDQEETGQQGDSAGVVPLPYVVIGGGIVMVLLLVNIACWLYYQCCSANRRQKAKYEVVSQVASSDDEEQDLRKLKA